MKTILIILTALFFTSKNYAQINIQMHMQNGVYYIPCQVNGTTLRFVFDTGASIVTISSIEADLLIKKGSLKKSDILQSKNYTMADGSAISANKIVLRELRIGNVVIKNVEAVVMQNQFAPLLLGQSALSKLGKFTFDYKNNYLKIGDVTTTTTTHSTNAKKNSSKTLKPFQKQLLEDANRELVKLLTLPKEDKIYDFYYNDLAKAYSYLAGTKFYTALDTLGALNDITKCINLFPLINEYKSISKYDFWTIQKTQAQQYHFRAEVKESLNDYYGAIMDINSAIQFNEMPRNAIDRPILKSDSAHVRYWIKDYNFYKRLDSIERAKLYYDLACDKMGLYQDYEYSEVIADYTKAINYSPSDNKYDLATYYLMRGELKILSGDKRGGCEDLGKGGDICDKLTNHAYEKIREYCY